MARNWPINVRNKPYSETADNTYYMTIRKRAISAVFLKM